MQPTNDKNALMKKRIPTIVGLGVLVIGLIIGVVFLSTGPGVFSPRATPETTPSKIKLTNVTDSGFTVSFFTSAATPGFIKYGTDASSIKSQTGDDRDQLSGTVGDYKLHHITVRGLNPGTSYYYVLGTGTNASYDNNGSPFAVKTAARGGAPSAAKTAYGNVLTNSGGPASGSVVYATLPGVGEMSSLVKSSGSWAIPLSNARKEDGSGYAVIDDSDNLSLFVQGVTPSLTSNVSILVSESQPVVDITAGEEVAAGSDVVEKRDVIADETTVVDQQEFSSDLDKEKTNENSGSCQTGVSCPLLAPPSPDFCDGGTIIAGDVDECGCQQAPQCDYSSEVIDNTGLGDIETSELEESTLEENTIVDFETNGSQVVTTQTPVISGLVAPNVAVKIVVNSDTQIEQDLVADENGVFVLDIEALKETLEPGEHTATYTYVDPATGKEVTKTVNFTVEANVGGTSEVTPYGSGNPFSIEDASESAQATESAQASDSGKIATRSAIPATDSAIPVSGSVETTMALVLGGIFFIMAGGWSYYLATQIEVKEI